MNFKEFYLTEKAVDFNGVHYSSIAAAISDLARKGKKKAEIGKLLNTSWQMVAKYYDKENWVENKPGKVEPKKVEPKKKEPEMDINDAIYDFWSKGVAAGVAATKLGLAKYEVEEVYSELEKDKKSAPPKPAEEPKKEVSGSGDSKKEFDSNIERIWRKKPNMTGYKVGIPYMDSRDGQTTITWRLSSPREIRHPDEVSDSFWDSKMGKSYMNSEKFIDEVHNYLDTFAQKIKAKVEVSAS
jgi:hypothetical protein